MTDEHNDIDTIPLHVHVERAAERYFEALGDAEAHNLYDIFLAEFEKPLLIATLKHTRGNQSKTRPNSRSKSWNFAHQAQSLWSA